MKISQKQVFKVADIHKLLKLVSTDKITYGRMVEIMNQMASEACNNDRILVMGNPEVHEALALSASLQQKLASIPIRPTPPIELKPEDLIKNVKMEVIKKPNNN